jgi:hypothetical protein
MCPLFRVEGLVAVRFAVAILSEILLEILDISVDTFRITDDSGPSDDCDG